MHINYNMNNKFLFSLIAALMIFAGCSTEGRRMKTESGYEYEIVRKGSGEAIPANSYVFFNMSLMADDSLLQSTTSTGRPTVIKLMDDNKNYGQLKSLVDLIGTLHKGDSLQFYFPLDSIANKPAEFNKLTGPLVYHVGIVDVMDDTQYQVYNDSLQAEQDKVRQAVRDRMPEIEANTKATYDAYKAGQLTDQMKTTESGLRYIIHEEGDGPVPQVGDQVSVHYYGMLDSDASMFDSSFRSGQPYQFPLGVGQVIRGWDEGLILFKKGTKATLFIPSALAYGAAGNPPRIPENADLIFYVELEK